MAVSVAIQLKVPKQLERTIGAIGKPRIDTIFDRGLNRMALDIQSIATRKYLSGPRPVKVDVVTGALRRSVRVDRGKLPRFIEIGSDLVYAPVHEFGAKINARGGGFLTFKLRDGSFRRVRSVTIPARPWLQPALDDADRKFPTILLQEIERSAR